MCGQVGVPLGRAIGVPTESVPEESRNRSNQADRVTRSSAAATSKQVEMALAPAGAQTRPSDPGAWLPCLSRANKSRPPARRHKLGVNVMPQRFAGN
jgi:hypothetical protein